MRLLIKVMLVLTLYPIKMHNSYKILLLNKEKGIKKTNAMSLRKWRFVDYPKQTTVCSDQEEEKIDIE